MSKLNDITFAVRDLNEKTLCVVPGSLLSGVIHLNGTVDNLLIFYKGNYLGITNITTKIVIQRDNILDLDISDTNLKEYLDEID